MSGVDITPITASVTGTVDTWTAVPPLPSGLVIDPATGTISGTPDAPAPRTEHDIAASNAGGSAHFTLTLQVVAAPRYLYATSSVDRSISLFADDVETGELVRAGQALTSASESAPERMVFDPSGRFAYVPSMTTGNVSSYRIDADTGLFTLVNTVPTAIGPHSIAVDPTSRFAYVASQGSDLLHQFSINPVTGALTQIGGPIATSFQPSDIGIVPAGNLLFITLRGRDTDGLGSAVQGFTIHPVTGQLLATWPNQLLQGGRPISMAIDPIDPVLYVTLEWFEDALPIRFDPVTGLMTPVALRHTGVMPLDIQIHVSGKFAYLVNQGDDTVYAYTVNRSTYLLGFPTVYGTGVAPTSLTLDPSGKFAYVAAKDSGEVIAYAIDETTGGLTEFSRLRTRGAPCDLAFGISDQPANRVPRFVHVAGRTSGDVTSYTIDPATGALTQTDVSPTGSRPSSIAIDPRARFAWIANEESSTISIRTLNATTGALGGSVLDQPLSGKPTRLAVDPTARFLYAVAHSVNVAEDGFLSAWSIDQATGALTMIESEEVGPNPSSVVVDPTGRFVYTANHGSAIPGSSGISIFAIDQDTGAVALAGPPAAAPGLIDLAFHPHGYDACAVLPSSNALVRYTFDPATGNLVAQPPVTSAGPEPYSLSYSPQGEFAYVASRGGGGPGNIALHAVNGSGVLSGATQSLQDGTLPTAIAVDPTGAFVYALNAGSDTISIARLDATSGEMTLMIPVATGVEPGAIAVTGITQ
jgi:6-phosphogluconolactonase (cycloisomerase 2 family)